MTVFNLKSVCCALLMAMLLCLSSPLVYAFDGFDDGGDDSSASSSFDSSDDSGTSDSGPAMDDPGSEDLMGSGDSSSSQSPASGDADAGFRAGVNPDDE